MAAYWRQHVRWAGGFQEVAQSHAGRIWRTRSLPLALRLELVLFSLGYADRVALATVAALAFLDIGSRSPKRISQRVLIIAVITPLLQVMAALRLAQAPLELWLRLPLLPVYFGIDFLMAMVGIARILTGRRPVWEPRVTGFIRHNP
jgi:hypothetical protein